MEWFDHGWGVSLATFLPALGAIVLLFIPSSNERVTKYVGTVFAGLALIAGIVLLLRFDFGASDQIQLGANAPWIEQINARFHIGVDGMSLPLLVLSVLV